MDVELASGRVIRLVRLEQVGTYLGLLCGRRGSEFVERACLRTARERAAEHCRPGQQPVLLAPEVAPVPEVTCIGTFHSDAFAARGVEPYTSLVAAWFEDDFRTVAGEATVRRLRLLDWERLAVEWCW